LSPIQLNASKRTANATTGDATSEIASRKKRCRFLIRFGRYVRSSVTCWLTGALRGFGRFYFALNSRIRASRTAN
jgi:hypothetical protein